VRVARDRGGLCSTVLGQRSPTVGPMASSLPSRYCGRRTWSARRLALVSETGHL